MNNTEYWIDRMVDIVETRLKRDNKNEYDRFSILNDDSKKEYVKVNWSKLIVQVDKQCLERVNQLLHPLLEWTLTNEGMSEISSDFGALLETATKNTLDYHLLMTELTLNSPHRSDPERIRLCLPSYLDVCEGMYAAHVNFIILNIVRNGRRYYRKDGEKRYHKNLPRLENITKEKLVHKLRFLSDEGFPTVSEACDRDLRNAIAHGDYRVSDDGILEYHSKVSKAIVRLNLETLLKKHEQLYMMAACLGRSIQVFYCRWLKEAMMQLPESLKEMYARQLHVDLDDLVE